MCVFLLSHWTTLSCAGKLVHRRALSGRGAKNVGSSTTKLMCLGAFCLSLCLSEQRRRRQQIGRDGGDSPTLKNHTLHFFFLCA